MQFFILPNFSINKKIYWGWYIVLGSFLLLGITYGTRYCFGIFIQPMTEQFTWSRSIFSMAAALMLFFNGLGGIISGKLVDIVRPKRIIVVGIFIMIAGLLLTGVSKHPWQFIVSYGILFGVGSSCTGIVVCNSYVGRWFSEKRGKAIGAATMGIGVITMLLVPFVGWIVKNHNWQSGYFIMAVLILLIGLCTSKYFFHKNFTQSPENVSNQNYSHKNNIESYIMKDLMRGINKALLFDSRFWLLIFCYTIAFLVQNAVFIHQIPYAEDQGIEKVAAAASFSFIGIASIFGRYFFGWLSDRLNDAKNSASWGFICMAAGMLLLLLSNNLLGLYVYSILFGFGYGSLSTMPSVLLANRFDPAILGEAHGWLIFFTAGIGGALGPLLAGLAFDYLGSYRIMWFSSLSGLLIIAITILFLKERKF